MSPDEIPVWFVLDGDVIVFMTGAGTVKGKSLARTRIKISAYADIMG
jgi:hypothetical protein